MHAASVHPEPGSNSLKNSISAPVGVNTFFRVSLTLILLLCLVCVFFWNFRDLSHDTSMHRSLCFISRLVVQFSMTYAVLAAQPDYYTAAKTVCQYLFENIFQKLFRSGYCPRPYQRPLLRSFVSIPLPFPLVNRVF